MSKNIKILSREFLGLDYENGDNVHSEILFQN